MRLPTKRVWSFGPCSPSPGTSTLPPGMSQGCSVPKRSSATSTLGAVAVSLVQPPAYADWKAVSRPGPVLAMPRPGSDGSNVPAILSPTTSIESDSSAIRSAMRRLVLARRLSLITPAGRCVAMIRWMPSERPRCAMSTTPSTNSGTSPASAANSSMTSTSAGGLSGSPRFSRSSRSFAFLRLKRCSR